ncbi:MAG: fasciclin domain-containing protein [Actinomycetota bacterium]
MSAGEETSTRELHYEVERRPIRWLALLGLIPLVGGVIVTNELIEDDLEDKALEAGALTASFTAQDGEICVADPSVEDAVRDITGVVKLDVDTDCPEAVAARDADAEARAEEEARAQADADAEAAATRAAEEEAAAEAEAESEATTTTTTTEPAPAIPDLVGSLDADGSFGTLIGLVDAAGLTDALSGDGPITLFAPNEDAFDALDPELVDALGADSDLLAAVLAGHAVEGALNSGDLEVGSLTSLAGSSLDIALDDGVQVAADRGDPATVTRPDLPAANGVIHEIDTVLLSPDVVASADGSSLDASASFAGTAITLSGTVDNETQRQALLDGALAAVGGDSSLVVDELVVGDATDSDETAAADERAAAFAGLLAALPPNFAAADATVGGSLTLSGNYLDDDAAAAAEAAALAAGVDPADLAIEPRPQATEADRDALIADLNELFVDQAIQFAPSSSAILPESETLLDEAAATLIQFDLTGIDIAIEGHTDSDGSEDSNLTLSQGRAEAVAQALVDRGIDVDALTPIGFGESQPIAPNDTDENKALNRRVTFSATA